MKMCRFEVENTIPRLEEICFNDPEQMCVLDRLTDTLNYEELIRHMYYISADSEFFMEGSIRISVDLYLSKEKKRLTEACLGEYLDLIIKNLKYVAYWDNWQVAESTIKKHYTDGSERAVICVEQVDAQEGGVVW